MVGPPPTPPRGGWQMTPRSRAEEQVQLWGQRGKSDPLYTTLRLYLVVSRLQPHPAPIQAQLAATLSLSMQFLVLDYQTMEM